MKKAFLFIVLACMACPVQICADGGDDDPLLLQVTIYDPTGNHGGIPKAPVQVPSVSLDDHTLYFFTPCDGCTLNLVDENDVVVYTIVIPAGTTSLVLPATLSGNFELQIIRGNYCFWGEITL